MKQTIRISENQLKQIIKESVKRVLEEGQLNELSPEVKMRAGFKALDHGQKERAKRLDPSNGLDYLNQFIGVELSIGKITGFSTEFSGVGYPKHLTLFVFFDRKVSMHNYIYYDIVDDKWEQPTKQLERSDANVLRKIAKAINQNTSYLDAMGDFNIKGY